MTVSYVASHQHWIEHIVSEVQSRKPHGPYTITSGITTSGPAHLGTICEFLYPWKIKQEFEKRGEEAKHIFIADILDAFDKIPVPMKEYEAELSQHLGKPLCEVPDPTGQAPNLGEHFFSEVLKLMKEFDAHPEVKRMNEEYGKGLFDDMARFFIAHRDEARQVLEEVSGRTCEKNWYPIQVICEKCGRIATPRVVSIDEEGNYEYVCDRDVGYCRGCGHRGTGNLKNHKYKLLWRLHWPAWMMVYGTDVEGAGADHHARGGSWDTTKAIFERLLNKKPPVAYKFGLIMFNGKKYSKSKGIGMGAVELLTVLPPMVVAYALLVPDVEENKDIPLNKEGLIRLIEKYERAASLSEKDPESWTRAERKMAIAYGMAGNIRWHCSMRDVIMFSTIFDDWNVVAEKVGDPEGAAYLRPYVETWKQKGYVPEDLDFTYQPVKAEGEVKLFFTNLPDDATPVEIHNAVFAFANEHNIPPKEMFKNIYRTLIGKDRGPRLGKLIHALGVERVKKDVL